ncbi:MAG: flagellar protein FlaG [Eubacteriales bacterium]|nr:flagellar protein FlaG [Eubacteriales bacterium]
MAVKGIGGVGALNVSSNVKQPVQRAGVDSVAAGSGHIQVETIRPVEDKKGSDQFGDRQQDTERGVVQSEQEIAPDKVKSAVNDLNRQVRQASQMKHTQLSFKYHDDTNRISITVTDSDTDEVIREIPPEKALDMLAKAWELAGLMVDERR